MLRLFLLLLAVVPLLWATPVLAQTPEADKATARQLAEEAYAALDASEFKRAEELFSRAESLHHAPTLLLGLARARVGLGKYVEARENYIQIIREKQPANASDAFVRAVKDARAEMPGLDEKIAWVTIQVTGAPEPEVALDGVQVSAASLGIKRAVNPGEHQVSAKAAGYLEQSKTFAAESGGAHEVSFVLEPDPNAGDEPAGGPAGVPPAGGASGGQTGDSATGADAADPGSTQRILGYVSLGVGGAGLILGVITGILAMGEHSKLEDDCPNEECTDPSMQSTIDSYDTTSTLSTVGFIAGGVLAATGIVLILTAPSADEQEPAAALRVGPTRLDLRVRF